jgi:hypothetical protein
VCVQEVLHLPDGAPHTPRTPRHHARRVTETLRHCAVVASPRVHVLATSDDHVLESTHDTTVSLLTATRAHTHTQHPHRHSSTLNRASHHHHNHHHHMSSHLLVKLCEISRLHPAVMNRLPTHTPHKPQGMSPATTATDSSTSSIHLLRLGCVAPVPRHHAVALRPQLTLRAHRDSRTFLVHDLTQRGVSSTQLDSMRGR